MNTAHVLIFLAIFVGGALAYGAIEHTFTRTSRPALRGRGALRARRVRHNRRCLPSALAPQEFPQWSEKAARLFLAGGSCKWR